MTEEKEIELRWYDLQTDLPKGDGCVVLFPQISDVGILYNVEHMYTSSNPEFARVNALRRGYTSWFPIPRHSQESEVKAKIEEMYKGERDADEQFYKGFQRATENIVKILKEIVPDRPNVARLIEERFGDKNNKFDSEPE
jgi:hypothetical protein